MAVGGRKPSVVSDKLDATHREQPDPTAAGGTITHIETPSILSTGGVEVWDLMVPSLLMAKVLREDDLIILVQCCESWAAAEHFRKRMWDLIAEQDELEDDIRRGGWTGDELSALLMRQEGMEQSVKRARTGWLQAQRGAASLSADLGLGPVARVRLGLAKVEGQSLLDAFQAARDRGELGAG